MSTEAPIEQDHAQDQPKAAQQTDNGSSDTVPAENDPRYAGANATLAVQLENIELTYETIREAIFDQAQELYEAGRSLKHLLLSKDIYEILDKRLAFKTSAHKDPVHFITPHGNLEVMPMSPELDRPRTFLIEG